MALSFVAILAILLGGSLIAIEMINVTRGFAAGEALYSKAQKSAVLSLHRYAAGGHAQDYQDFLEAMAIPIGDNVARRALERQPPDYALAEEGLIAGRNHAADVRNMARLFVWLSFYPPLQRAAREWRDAEPLIYALHTLGQRLHADAVAGRSAADLRRDYLGEADALDARLTRHEESFSFHIGEAARGARDLLALGLSLTTLLLGAGGTALGVWIHRRNGVADRLAAASQARVRDFAEVASDWFWEMDADLRFSSISDRFVELTATPASHVIGKTRQELAANRAAEPAWQEHMALLARRLPFKNFVYRVDLPDGSIRYWSANGKPIFDEDEAFIGYRGTGNDVTEQVAKQLELVEAKQRAEDASRAKSEFLANMSHELRTPLNAIMGFSEIIRGEMLGRIADRRYSEYAADIHRSAEHLLSIINDILDLSKIESGVTDLHEAEIDPADLTAAVVPLLNERVLAGQLTLRVILPEGMPKLWADALKLKRILINLLSNAVKFTPPGGQIELEYAWRDDGMAIYVRDTGIGMAASDIPRALTPFTQLESSYSRHYEGTGLGLPLTKKLIELHQGVLRIDSEPGRGTCVSVLLPASRLRQATLAAALTPGPTAVRR